MRISVLVCAVLLCASAYAQQVGELITGQTAVVDGDTFDIGRDCGSWRMRDACRRIRIWGIDAPERRAHCTSSGKTWKLAAPSAAALETCLKGSTVTCRVQKIERRWLKTRYVSECWRDDSKEDVASCMVRVGWAADYPGFSGGFYAALEGEAKAAKRGMWLCEDEPPVRRWCRGGRASPSTSRGGRFEGREAV